MPWGERSTPPGPPGSATRVSHGMVLHQSVHTQADNLADAVEAFLGGFDYIDTQSQEDLKALDDALEGYRKAVTECQAL